MEQKLIKKKLENRKMDNDKDCDEDGSSVEKLLVKMEPEDLRAEIK